MRGQGTRDEGHKPPFLLARLEGLGTNARAQNSIQNLSVSYISKVACTEYLIPPEPAVFGQVQAPVAPF